MNRMLWIMKLLRKSFVDPVDNKAAAEFFRGALAHHSFDVDAGADVAGADEDGDGVRVGGEGTSVLEHINSSPEIKMGTWPSFCRTPARAHTGVEQQV